MHEGRAHPIPNRFQAEAWVAIQRDLLVIARKWGPIAYRAGVKKATDELAGHRIPDLFDPRGQAFTQEFNYRSIRSLTARTSILVQDEMLNAIRDGLGVDDVAKRLDAVLEGRVATVDTIARTEANRAANWGRYQGWRKSGVVKGREAIATLDDRVRPDHLAAHGEVAPLEVPFTRGAAAGQIAPPWDPNCRCTIAPVTILTPTNQAGTEVTADVEAAEDFAEEEGIALAVPRHHVPGLIGIEDAYAADLRRAWREGMRHLEAALREANR